MVERDIVVDTVMADRAVVVDMVSMVVDRMEMLLSGHCGNLMHLDYYLVVDT